ncbi:hypothetical protein [Arthrobacter pascens]|uniref:hypothetical protein n=1 Tax=Arthrobacter pascens TaxID=1677 RepID=UPI00196B3855|nr:hypothetical protein [Arthrobacter pascens]MBN3498599.1 hypothetical protein [Arthrobacter pascens]
MTPEQEAAFALISQVLERPGSLTDAHVITAAMDSEDPQQRQLDIAKALVTISAGLMDSMAEGHPDGGLLVLALVLEAFANPS